MPNLEIIGWESKGIRIPDTKVELASEMHHTYIQMPNGMGKTTTLWLIEFALSDTQQETHPELTYIDGKKDLSTKLIKDLRKNDAVPSGEFKLRTKLDGKNLDIHLDLNFDFGKYSRTYSYAGQPKRPLSETGKPVRNLINSGVSNYILLDGERAKHFLDGTKTSAKQAIHSLYKIELIGDAHTDCTFHMDEMRTSLGGKAGVIGKVTQAHNEYISSLGLKDRRKARLGEIDAEITEKSKEIKELGDQINSIGLGETEHKEKVDKLETEEKDYKTKRKEHQDLAMEQFKSSPLAILPEFSDNLTSLFECLDKNKLPEAAGKEWFLELAEAEYCVCGDEMTVLMSDKIRKKSSQFLSGNHQAVLNAVKGNYRQVILPLITKGDTELYFSNLKDHLKHAGTMSAEAMSKHNEIENIATKAAEEQGVTDKVSKLIIKRTTEETNLTILEDEKVNLSGTITNDKSLKWAEKEAETKERELKRYRDSYVLTQRETIIREIVEQVKENVTKTVCKEITEATNTKTESILKTTDMELETIDKSLILKGGKGGGSMGQTLVLAYSFLEALHAKNNYEMPLIIDSPVGNLDNTNRREVADLLWNMDRKIIIFVINSEKPSFIDRLVKHAKDNKRVNELSFITNITMDGKTANFYNNLVATGNANKNGSGGISYEHEFFERFDVEEEGK